jgi:CRP/FNR family transcriptional regulator
MSPANGCEIQENCATCQWRAHRLFCSVSGTALRQLQRIATLHVGAAGDVLYSQGQTPKGIFILCNGRAKISAASGRGSILIFRIAQPGEALGLEAVLANRPYEESAELFDVCQVKFITSKDALAYFAGNAQAALKTALQMARNHDSAREQIRRIGFSISGTQKLAQLLMLWASESSCAPEHESTFLVPYTHEEIAQMIGSTRETVTRVLSKFRQVKAIDIQDETFVVKDLSQLAQFAGD